MSYPLLRARQNYVNAEVRQGYGFPAFEQMAVIHYGPVYADNEWTRNEGDRICVKCTNNPTGDLSGQPVFCASSTSGISEGQASVSEF